MGKIGSQQTNSKGQKQKADSVKANGKRTEPEGNYNYSDGSSSIWDGSSSIWESDASNQTCLTSKFVTGAKKF